MMEFWNAHFTARHLDDATLARRRLIAAAERYGEEWTARVPVFAENLCVWLRRDGAYWTDGYRTVLLGNVDA